MGWRNNAFANKGWRHCFEKIIISFSRQIEKWNASARLLAVNDLLNLTENTVHTARFVHNIGPISIQQSCASIIADQNLVTATSAHPSARQRPFCACGSRRSWLDYVVNLILGLLGLDQSSASVSGEVLKWYKFTLLEQICPKHFDKFALWFSVRSGTIFLHLFNFTVD